jgi:RNA polymerase sigma-70 factor (ECF subfamily)
MSGPGVTKSRALSTLLQNHRLFLAFLERRVGTRADAEDILQTAFLKMVETRAGLRSKDRVVAWFYQVLRNALRDHYRRHYAEQRAHVMAAHTAELFRAPEPDPELEDAVCRCVTILLGTLKGEYAQVLKAVELRGGKIADFAAKTGISPGRARVRLHRARRALRGRLERACGIWARHGGPHCTCRIDGRGS